MIIVGIATNHRLGLETVFLALGWGNSELDARRQAAWNAAMQPGSSKFDFPPITGGVAAKSDDLLDQYLPMVSSAGMFPHYVIRNGVAMMVFGGNKIQKEFRLATQEDVDFWKDY